MALIPLSSSTVRDCLYIYCEKTILFWLYICPACSWHNILTRTHQWGKFHCPHKEPETDWLVSLACNPNPNHSNLINIQFIYPRQVYEHMNPYWVSSMVSRSDLELESWKTKSEWVLRGLWDFCPVPGKQDIFGKIRLSGSYCNSIGFALADQLSAVVSKYLYSLRTFISLILSTSNM